MKQIFARDYGILPDVKDPMNTLRLRNMLEEHRTQDEVEFCFEKGIYHFYPDYAQERVLCISNHDEDALKRIAFDLTGFHNVKISGDDSDFIFHTELIGFYIHESSQVTLSGFSYDYDRPAYTEGLITGVNGRTMQLRIDKERFPYHVIHKRIFFDGENFCNEIPYWMEVDPSKDAPSDGPLEGGFDVDHAGVYGEWKELEEGLVEVTLDDEAYSFLGYTPGHIMVLRHHPRSYPAIYITDSKDIIIQDVTLYHTAGMGVIAQFTENILLDQVRVTNRPGSGHWFSLCADATHFVYCKGLIEIKDSLFEHQLDDAVNVHGIFARIKEVLSDKELLVELVHHQQKGVPVGKANDKISFVNYRTMLSKGLGRIEEVRQLNKDFSYVRFCEAIPEVQKKDVIENISYAPDVWIHGSVFKNNRARGILLTSAGKTIVEKNKFHTAGAAILISGDSENWFESGATKNIIVRENHFDQCDYVKNWGKAVIHVNTIVQDTNQKERIHKRIEIDGNIFDTEDAKILNAKNVETLMFTNNQIRGSKRQEESFVIENITSFDEKQNLFD